MTITVKRRVDHWEAFLPNDDEAIYMPGYLKWDQVIRLLWRQWPGADVEIASADPDKTWECVP